MSALAGHPYLSGQIVDTRIDATALGLVPLAVRTSGEGIPESYLQVREEGSRQVTRSLRHYNLDAILATGFRVRSHRGTQFRQWAMTRLGEYLVKGFTMDDERLQNPPGPGQRDYFDELLERIREIRASERRFYQKVLDIYATSVDYDPSTGASQRFFATVQNKMHWATHGHTAAEIVYERAASIAKNYLTESELAVLHRIVNLYIEYAELQALERKPMAMQDWIAKLDEFLKAAGRQLLDHPGSVSAEAPKAKADAEYARYHALLDAQPRAIDAEFEKVARQLAKPAAPRGKKGRNR